MPMRRRPAGNRHHTFIVHFVLFGRMSLQTDVTETGSLFFFFLHENSSRETSYELQPQHLKVRGVLNKA